MERSEIRVLIVEDDANMAKAFTEIIKRAGFMPVVCSTPTEAQNQFRIQGAQLAILDCLLPKMSGIDLAAKLREVGDGLPIVLTSGIYKDKSFMKEATQKTGAVAFLPKPFNVKDLETILSTHLDKLVNEASPREILLTSPLTPGERVKNVNILEQVEAYDIPWLCCLLTSPHVSGMLNFQNDKSKATISFGQGKIVQVEMQNPESFFGAVLIEKGYLTPQQLDEALRSKSPKRIGERLVELNLLSPHVIDVVNAEQTAIRLSKIINDTSYYVTFSAKEIEPGPSSIDSENLSRFLVDWIHSKISPSWLKQRYMKWLNSPTVRIKSNVSYSQIWNVPPLNTPGIVAEFENGASLAQVLAKSKYKEELVYQAFHLLILTDYLRLTREERIIDEVAQTNRLRKLWEDMVNQDYFAALGVSRTARPADIKKVFYELAKIFHPDKLPASATAELKDLAKKVFGHMNKAYETLSNDARRTAYVKELEMGRAEKILQAEGIMEEGKTLLKSGQASKAREKFEYAISLAPPSSDILIHLAWAKMMAIDSEAATDEALLQVEGTLSRIPPEDRHNYIYYFVKGLYQKMIGEVDQAKKSVAHALSLNPKFTEAERLLRLLEMNKRSSKGILNGDLKDVVGSLFKKR